MARQNRNLSSGEIDILRQSGCSSSDWSRVSVSDLTDLTLISGVRFEGDVFLSALSEEGGGYISNVLLRDCRIGSEVRISNIGGCISGYTVGDRAVIENVGRLEGEQGASCGRGTEVAVLDETGSRSVRIYPGLTAQLAALRAFYPHKTGEMWDVYDENPAVSFPRIGEDSVVRDCIRIKNVDIAPGVIVEGAVSLVNGSVVNNVTRGKSAAYIGYGVRAENFILEDGILSGGADVKNCYIGQTASVGHSFSAHDCLIFCNSTLENGEACAVLAGPYTVSMHKSTLLIGAVYSFMNAGSATNFSNHLYKLGPVHWGVMERGVKTSSGSYMMWGGRIGAYSMLMGTHKNHPDTSRLPFSYLFEGKDGETVVAPGRMLISCGLMRDEKKWPMRDHRTEFRMEHLDNVCFETLNPVTVSAMMNAVEWFDTLLSRKPDSDGTYKEDGLVLRRSAVEKGRELYLLAIARYFSDKTGGELPPESEERPGEWIDLCGQILPRSEAGRALQSESPAEAAEILSDAFEDYAEAEKGWIAWRFRGEWGTRMEGCAEKAREFDRLREKDRTDYLAMLSNENSSQTSI